MKYLCVGYFDPIKMDRLDPVEIDALMASCLPHMEQLRETGRMLLVAGTDTSAKHIKKINDRIEISEEANQENAAKIGCVFIVEAGDMSEAVRLASLHPTTQVEAGEKLGWWTEIRPIHFFESHLREELKE